jgi:iron complex outermembrane receptor protein
VPEADPRGFYRQIGAAASHGFEVEAVGSVTRGLGIRAGYAWTDTEITRDTAGFSGRELPNAPHHKAELWGRYRVTAGGLSGLMVAAGVVAVSAQHTARDNLVTLPAYTRVDASTTYPLGSFGLTVGLIAQNLTDRRYVTSGAGATFFAAPLRRVAVQLNASFD